MKKCVIVCAGDISDRDIPEKKAEDLWIAADGGAAILDKYGIKADVFIGDMDSSLGSYGEDKRFLLPRRKDDTDSAAAVKYALSSGYKDIVLLGALGGKRLSHTFANLQLLSFIRRGGADGTVLHDDICARCLLPGEKVLFDAKGFFSLFSLSERSSVDINGALFEGSGIVLERTFPLGISNEALECSEVKVNSGEVLCITEFTD